MEGTLSITLPCNVSATRAPRGCVANVTDARAPINGRACGVRKLQDTRPIEPEVYSRTTLSLFLQGSFSPLTFGYDLHTHSLPANNQSSKSLSWLVQMAEPTGQVLCGAFLEVCIDFQLSYSLTVFSPSGKLVQIEHALAAVSQGTTSLGIKGVLFFPSRTYPSSS